MPHPSEWPTLQSILQSHNEVAAKYTLTPRLWEYLQDYRAKHEKAGNGFGYSLFWTGRCGPHPLGPLLVREPDPLDRDAGLVCGLTEKSAEGVHALDSCPRDTCGSTSVPVTVFTPTPAKYSESEPACMSALIDRTHHGRVRSAMHQAGMAPRTFASECRAAPDAELFAPPFHHRALRPSRCKQVGLRSAQSTVGRGGSCPTEPRRERAARSPRRALRNGKQRIKIEVRLKRLGQVVKRRIHDLSMVEGSAAAADARKNRAPQRPVSQ